MELEILRALDEGINVTDQLLHLLALDKDGINTCIRGEIMVKYNDSTERVIETVSNLKHLLLTLRAEQNSLL